MIGKRLKGARAASGLSLRALSDAMENKVSAQAIGKYERNEDMPGSGVLLSLARALEVSVDFLLSDDELELEGVEFRKSASSSAKEIATLRLLVMMLRSSCRVSSRATASGVVPMLMKTEQCDGMRLAARRPIRLFSGSRVTRRSA